jgi:hypothetical protein
VPAYWYLIGFYFGFTAMVCVTIIREYILVNVSGYSIRDIFHTYAVSTVIGPVFLGSLALFLNRLKPVRYTASRVVVVACVVLATALLAFLPGAVTLKLDTASLTLGGLYQLSNALYMALFAYVMWIIPTLIRRDRPPRETEVIDLLNRGLSNREIAEKLYVGIATVKTHAHSIYEKTGASSRYDLFRLVRGGGKVYSPPRV